MSRYTTAEAEIGAMIASAPRRGPRLSAAVIVSQNLPAWLVEAVQRESDGCPDGRLAAIIVHDPRARGHGEDVVCVALGDWLTHIGGPGL